MGGAGDVSLGWESAKGMAAKMVQAALGFGGTIIFARLLGPTSFGGFYFLLTLVFLSDRPLRGFGSAVGKRYSEADTPKDELMGGALLVNTLYFLLVGVVLFAVGDLLAAETNVEGAVFVFAALIVTVGYFFIFQQMLGAHGWVGRQTWNDTLRSVLTLVFQLIFVGLGFGAAGMGYGLALASLAVVPVALYFLTTWPAVPSVDTIRSLLSFAKYSIPAAIVGKAYDRVDVVLIGAVLSTAAVGYYEVAFKLTVPATFLPGVIASGLMPKVSNLDSRGEEISDDVGNVVAYISSLSIPIFFGALAIPRNLVVTPYGSEYAAAAELLVGLALYQMIWSQTKVYQKVLSGLDLPDVGLRVDAVALALNVVLGIALVLTVGILGVVVATVVSEALRLVLSAWAVHQRISGIELLPRPLIMQVVAGVVMFVAIEAATAHVPLRTLLDIVLLIGFGVVVYCLILVLISPGLRVTLRSVYRDAVEGRAS